MPKEIEELMDDAISQAATQLISFGSLKQYFEEKKKAYRKLTVASNHKAYNMGKADMAQEALNWIKGLESGILPKEKEEE